MQMVKEMAMNSIGTYRSLRILKLGINTSDFSLSLLLNGIEYKWAIHSQCSIEQRSVSCKLLSGYDIYILPSREYLLSTFSV